MPSDYPVETVIDYAKRYSHKGKPQLWLNVGLDNDPPDDPPVELSFAGNTDVNKTLYTYQVRPGIGHYVATKSLTEDRTASLIPINNLCSDVPKEWRIREEKLGIETEIGYSNNPLIDYLFHYATNSTRTDKIKGFGGKEQKDAIFILLVTPNIVSYIPNLYKCELMKGIIVPAKKTFSNQSYTTIPLKFLAQQLTKIEGGYYSIGSKSVLEWFVEVRPTENILYDDEEVFDLIAAG